MRKTRPFSHAELLELLSYDGDSGVFHWKRSRQGQAKSGDVAGCNSHGYTSIRIYGTLHGAHRLAWFYVHGEWPKNDIDHLNGVRSDNRIANLRDVQRIVNIQNQRKATGRNSSGLIGAHKSGKKFVSSICAAGKMHYLGRFETAEQAHFAYIAAKRNLHIGCTL